MLPTLGVMPTLGRNFSQEEDQPGGQQVVILSDGVWRRRFGADPNVIGKTLMLSGSAFTVVGIMPSGFVFPVLPNREIWTTMQIGPTGRGNAVIRVVARLKPGVALTQAEAELTTIAARLEAVYPDANANVGITVVSLHEQLVGNVRLPLLVLLGAVGFVLLIACANVANLLLARDGAAEGDWHSPGARRAIERHLPVDHRAGHGVDDHRRGHWRGGIACAHGRAGAVALQRERH